MHNDESLRKTPAKIKKLLESSSPSSGIEILRSIKDHKTIDSLSEFIIPAILKVYFNHECTEEKIKDGIKLFKEFNLSKNLTFIELMDNFEIKNFNIGSFTNLEEIIISGCESLESIEGLQELESLTSLIIQYDCPNLRFHKEDIEKIETVEGAIVHDGVDSNGEPMFKLYIHEYDLEDLWDQMNDLFPYIFGSSGNSYSFSDFKEAEELMKDGDVYLLTVPEWSNLSHWQFQAKWSDTKSRDSYKESFKGFENPAVDELVVVIYTESWNLVTAFTFQKNQVMIDCSGCIDPICLEDDAAVHEGEIYCSSCSPE